jgi:hypothetical protein
MWSPWVGRRRGDWARPVGSKISSLSATVEETRRQWGNREDNQTGSMRHQEPNMHRVCDTVKQQSLLYYIYSNCNRDQCLTLIICFRRINHKVVKNHLHSSSDVHNRCVEHKKCGWVYRSHQDHQCKGRRMSVDWHKQGLNSDLQFTKKRCYPVR